MIGTRLAERFRYPPDRIMRVAKPEAFAALAAALRDVVATRLLLSTAGLDAARAYVQRARPGPLCDRLRSQRLVAWSVTAASRFVPGATCLTQALAGQRLLRCRGVPSRVRIGVRADDAWPSGGNLAAHAWLIDGETILLGGRDGYEAHATIRELADDADG